MPFEYKCNSQQRSRWTLVCLLPVLMMLGFAFFPQSAMCADFIKAFYYNTKGQLLQVESVSATQITSRTLVPPGQWKLAIPTLGSGVQPLITGNNKPMSKFATVAVYYKSQGTAGDQNVPATLIGVEDLQWVHERTLTTCLPNSPGLACSLPKSCHCMGVCCCY